MNPPRGAERRLAAFVPGMGCKMKRSWFLLFMAVMTTAVCGVAGAVFAYGVVRQAGTTGWPTVQGTVTASRVVSQRGGKGGRTYRPEVTFTYAVGPSTYTGDRVTLSSSMGNSGGGYAQRTVAEFPVGKAAPVYYNPADPGEAVLKRGLGEREWRLLPLISVLLSIPAITWTLFVAAMVDRGTRVGTVRVLEPAPGVTVVRSLHVSALASALIGWGVGQAVTLIVATAVLDEHIREGVLIGWGAAAVLAVGGWVLRSRWIAAGRRDHVIDINSGVVILARGVRSAAESLALASITGTVVRRDSPISTNKQQHWRVHLVAAGEAKTRPLVDIQREQDAREFDGWLRNRLGLPEA